MALFSEDGLQFLFRWGHFLAGVTWIGVLYYFNFIQGAFFNETDAEVKTKCVQKLVPRALWWFRWGAMVTILTGLFIIWHKGHVAGHQVYATSWGLTILLGAVMGIFMWFNVWFVIWPAQKLVIAAAKGEPAQNAAQKGARAAIASRTNTLFSIPMLFFMAAASHLPLEITALSFTPVILALGGIVLAIEANALFGKMGPMATIKGVITSGFILTAVLYAVMEVLV